MTQLDMLVYIYAGVGDFFIWGGALKFSTAPPKRGGWLEQDGWLFIKGKVAH
ncbi:hypothetical protein GCM10008967_00540 [Bacillus carboniphilus]|uniref:Uncharacterized protein n=1 Tax=Bacillus carboniphilus TaxID=86663 RepID=A0ABN0VPE3_9BACI